MDVILFVLCDGDGIVVVSLLVSFLGVASSTYGGLGPGKGDWIFPFWNTSVVTALYRCVSCLRSESLWLDVCELSGALRMLARPRYELLTL